MEAVLESMWKNEEQRVSYQNCVNKKASPDDIWSCYWVLYKGIKSGFSGDDTDRYYAASEKHCGPDFKEDMARAPEVLIDIAEKNGINLDSTEKQILKAGYAMVGHNRNLEGFQFYAKYPYLIDILGDGKVPKLRWQLLKEAMNPLICGNGVALMEESVELNRALFELEENWVRQKRCGALMSREEGVMYQY